MVHAAVPGGQALHSPLHVPHIVLPNTGYHQALGQITRYPRWKYVRWMKCSVGPKCLGGEMYLLDPLNRMSVGEMSTGEIPKDGVSLQINFPWGFICVELNTLWTLLSVLLNVSL